MIRILALVAVLLLPSLAGAQAAPQTPEPEPLRLVIQGDRAPFTGILILQDDLVNWRVEIEALREQIRLAEIRHTDRTAALADLWAVRVQAEVDRRLLHEEMWRDRAEELAQNLRAERNQRSRWFRNPAIMLVLGMATGAVLVCIPTIAASR